MLGMQLSAFVRDERVRLLLLLLGVVTITGCEVERHFDNIYTTVVSSI
jgi:hypothetical protein